MPAIWLLGIEGEWPAGGEIDIAEVVGDEPATLYGSAHGPSYSDEDGPSTSTDLGAPASDGFPDYAVAKSADAVTWSVHGREYARLDRDDIEPEHRWVLDQPMALVVDIAVGGSWPGDITAETTFPAVMRIDRVRMSGDLVEG